jgi:purine-binding chemotaxis protein CheW
MQAIEKKEEVRTIGVREFLTFRLGHEEYGCDILKVQEIRGYENPTRIANAPEFIKGVVNLRGTIVPIIDMRIKFNVGEVKYDTFTVVIILNIANRVLGMVVDSVSDVLQIEEKQIRPAPDFSEALDVSYVMGLGAIDDRMLILVDIEKLMTSEEMQMIELSAEDKAAKSKANA